MTREAELRKEIENMKINIEKREQGFLGYREIDINKFMKESYNQLKMRCKLNEAELKGITETKEKIIKAIEDLSCEDYTIEVEERDKQIIKLIGEIK